MIYVICVSEGIVVSKLCDLLLLGYLGTGRSPGSQVPAYQPTLGRVQGGVTTPPAGGAGGQRPPQIFCRFCLEMEQIFSG